MGMHFAPKSLWEIPLDSPEWGEGSPLPPGGGVSGWASGRGPPQGLKRSCAGGLFIMSSRSNNRALAVTVGAFVFFFCTP